MDSKLFLLDIFLTKISLNQIIYWPRMFRTQNFWGPKILFIPNFFWTQKTWRPKITLDLIFFTQIFVDQNFFLATLLLDPPFLLIHTFSIQNSFLPKNVFDKIFFEHIIIFNFLDHHLFDQKSFEPTYLLDQIQILSEPKIYFNHNCFETHISVVDQVPYLINLI